MLNSGLHMIPQFHSQVYNKETCKHTPTQKPAPEYSYQHRYGGLNHPPHLFVPSLLSTIKWTAASCLGILLKGSVPLGNEPRPALIPVLSYCICSECELRLWSGGSVGFKETDELHSVMHRDFLHTYPSQPIVCFLH